MAARGISIALGLAIVVVLAILYPPAQGVYNFFSDKNVFREVFFGRLGLGKDLSNVLSVVCGVVAATLSSLVFSWSILRLFVSVRCWPRSIRFAP